MTPDDVITQVLDNQNEDIAGLTNIQKFNFVLFTLEVESLDITADFDFDLAYRIAQGGRLQAAMFVADLKFQIYQGMRMNHIGDMQHNELGYQDSLYWRQKLNDKLNAEMTKTEVVHKWLN